MIPPTPGFSAPGNNTHNWLPEGVRPRLGAYTLTRLLGQGGFGTVFEARHDLLGLRVALKVLRWPLTHDAHAVERFQREMAALGRLADHPNLVRAHYAGEDQGCPFLAMDYVEGLDLDRLLRGHGPLSAADACEVTRQAALGLAAIAQAGLVHRDLKPSNLMVTLAGVVKVMDLGLARASLGDAGPELTPSNAQMGTFDYQAPEQAEDPRRVDIRADIYSLGCTLFRLLTGRAPFGHLSGAAGKVNAHAHEPLPPLPPTAPPGLSGVLSRLVAKRPADRFTTPEEVAAALAPFTTGARLDALLHHAASHPVGQVVLTTPPGGPVALTSAEKLTPTFRPVAPRLARAGLVVAMISLAGALAAAPLLWPARQTGVAAPESPPPPADPIAAAGTTPFPLDPVPPYQAYPLLDRAPVEAHWNRGDGLAFRTYDPVHKHLIVNAPREGLFHLGTLSQPAFVLQALIQQPQWTRGAGVYLGYRTPPGAPGPVFQYLLFSERNGPDGPHTTLVRGRASVTLGNGPPRFHWNTEAEQDIERPAREAWLIIEVIDSHTSRVRLNGVELRRLTERPVTAAFTADDHRGCLGVFNRANSCTFRQASLTIQADR